MDIVIISILAVISYIVFLIKDIHIFQLEEYHPKNLAMWIVRNKKSYFTYTLAFIVFALFDIMVPSNVLSYCILGIICVIYGVNLYKRFKTPEKISLKYTGRAKRIIYTSCILFAIEYILILLTSKKVGYILSIAPILSCLNIVLANVILKPIQKLINNKFTHEAIKILEKRKAQGDLIIIGITGSYGKTSTKFILQTILSEKYNTLATPNSFNTPLGNVITIREHLKPEHQILISEMGARKLGEIREICDFVHPKYGIITSIGKQHLETFKNIENIIQTKNELMESLPQDGVAFFPADNIYTKELYEKESRKKYLYGLENKDLDLDLYVKDIKVSSTGSTFTLCTKKDSIECNTILLGEHNVLNILGCAAIAYELGLTLEEIKKGISKISPIEHRLELILNPNGTTVLDDSYNSNPNGTKVALKVLSSFEKNKIIITPGMVELGEEEYDLNKEFGKNIASVATYAILVGKNRTKAIYEGLLEASFDIEKIFVVDTLNEATTKLGEIIKAGDVVLFENDLPDNYNE